MCRSRGYVGGLWNELSHKKMTPISVCAIEQKFLVDIEKL